MDYVPGEPWSFYHAKVYGVETTQDEKSDIDIWEDYEDYAKIHNIDEDGEPKSLMDLSEDTTCDHQVQEIHHSENHTLSSSSNNNMIIDQSKDSMRNRRCYYNYRKKFKCDACHFVDRRYTTCDFCDQWICKSCAFWCTACKSVNYCKYCDDRHQVVLYSRRRNIWLCSERRSV